jgi:hypothetical protein
MITKAFKMAAYGFKAVPQKAEDLTMALLVKMKDAGIVAMNGVYDAVTPKQPVLARVPVQNKQFRP